MDTKNIRQVLDQIDAVIYISDLETHEMLYLNRYGVSQFGGFKPGGKMLRAFTGSIRALRFLHE